MTLSRRQFVLAIPAVGLAAAALPRKIRAAQVAVQTFNGPMASASEVYRPVTLASRPGAQQSMTAAQRDELELWPHLGMRSAQYLDADAQIRLLRVLRWRDAYARDNDRPRTWILESEFAATLARSPPTDLPSLQSQLDAQPKAPRKLAAAIWAALHTPLADEGNAPSVRSEETDKHALRKLQQAVAARSAELGLPDGVLASRRWLEPLLDGKDWPGPLAGWRRDQLEPALTPLLPPTGGRTDPSV